ncbi:hypothetical protein ACZ87_00724 [Candidatus Erwinia dacicola]|uniref:Uncharacterized protein n=1 Tax=Candidatus Erwinia dacicola TaxID=252393 RepID=A0A328TUI4_9GAMM|nr:hypothetical protein ACZ87_00724 [Candidatus Erwinia dacicola]
MNLAKRSGVIGTVSLFTASAQEAERTAVREHFAHCRGTKSPAR